MTGSIERDDHGIAPGGRRKVYGLLYAATRGGERAVTARQVNPWPTFGYTEVIREALDELVALGGARKTSRGRYCYVSGYDPTRDTRT